MKFITGFFLLVIFSCLVTCGSQHPVPENSSFEVSLEKEISEILQTQKSVPLDSIEHYSVNARELDCKGLPDSVWEMKSLKSLFVQGEDCDYGPIYENGKRVCCGIFEISAKIGQLTELEELTLRINPISSLPDEIVQCHKLKIIDLTDCTMSTIDNLTGMIQLEELLLYGGHIEKLPQDIGKLKNLKILGLAGNPISEEELERVKNALPGCDIVF